MTTDKIELQAGILRIKFGEPVQNGSQTPVYKVGELIEMGEPHKNKPMIKVVV